MNFKSLKETPNKKQQGKHRLNQQSGRNEVKDRLSHSHDDLHSGQKLNPIVATDQQQFDCKYAPTKIKIWHPWDPIEDIGQHPINMMFSQYNDFVR